jgi:hypothetical protein
MNPSKTDVPEPVMFPDAVIFPDALSVVNAPVEALVAPIGVLLMLPPVMAAPLITGEVNVLLVNVSSPSNVTIVPDDGHVIELSSVAVNVML